MISIGMAALRITFQPKRNPQATVSLELMNNTNGTLMFITKVLKHRYKVLCKVFAKQPYKDTATFIKVHSLSLAVSRMHVSNKDKV